MAADRSCGLLSKNRTMAMVFLLVLFCSGFGLSSAAVLKVGDDVGWTIGKTDYGTWASKKTFHVGDTLLFVYNNSYHNVMEVKKAEYIGCTVKSPIATYATGKDSITIKSQGDHYYLCGFPTHCQAGQKLKITALAKGSSAAPSASPAGSPSISPAAAPSASPTSSPSSGGTSSGSGSSSTPAAAPGSSNAAMTCKGFGLVVSLAVAAVSAGVMIIS